MSAPTQSAPPRPARRPTVAATREICALGPAIESAVLTLAAVIVKQGRAKASAATADKSAAGDFYDALLRAAFGAVLRSAAAARGLEMNEDLIPAGAFWQTGRSALLPPRETERLLKPLTDWVAKRDPPPSARDLGAAHEFMLELTPLLDGGRFALARRTGHARKTTGSYYTPEGLIDYILDAGLEPVLDEAQARGHSPLNIRVCDPACGTGHFLAAAAHRIARRLGNARSTDHHLATIAGQCLFGTDKHPLAADLCRAALWLDLSRPGRPAVIPPEHIARTDALLDDWPARFPAIFARGGFDAVVGNPPFLNQLGATTVTTRDNAAKLKALYPGVLLPYTDPAALFLVLASRITRPGGRVALVQPQSTLAARDARGARAEVARRGRAESLWIAGEHIFDAQVLVCAPAIHIGGPRTGPLRRSVGRDFRPLAGTTIDADALASEDSWAPLAAPALGIPEVHLDTARTLADLARATADFRDQYYGLRGLITEDSELPAAARPAFPPLITTGLIDPAVCLWGRAPTRFDGRPWRAPRVDLERLRTTTDLGPWARQRLIPKILLATQTRILEAAIDARGQWLPAVPLITIVPRQPDDLWRLAAALLSPPLSAWAAARYALTALSPGAIKLSAKQALGLPMPQPGRDWDEAAALVQAAVTNDGSRPALLAAAAEHSMRAFGLCEPAAAALLAWWQERLRPAPRR